MPPMDRAERALYKALKERVDELHRTHHHDVDELHHRVFNTNEARIQTLYKELHEQDKFAKADHIRLKVLEQRWGYILKGFMTVIAGTVLAAIKAYI